MANYYWVKINSEKATQKVANEIFSEMANKNKIRHFDYVEGGHISYNTRGLTDIQHILDTYGITDEEVEIKDEFELVYESYTEEELIAMGQKNKELEMSELKNFKF